MPPNVSAGARGATGLGVLSSVPVGLWEGTKRENPSTRRRRAPISDNNRKAMFFNRLHSFCGDSVGLEMAYSETCGPLGPQLSLEHNRKNQYDNTAVTKSFGNLGRHASSASQAEGWNAVSAQGRDRDES